MQPTAVVFARSPHQLLCNHTLKTKVHNGSTKTNRCKDHGSHVRLMSHSIDTIKSTSGQSLLSKTSGQQQGKHASEMHPPPPPYTHKGAVGLQRVPLPASTTPTAGHFTDRCSTLQKPGKHDCAMGSDTAVGSGPCSSKINSAMISQELLMQGQALTTHTVTPSVRKQPPDRCMCGNQASLAELMY